jgi:hypothetical protein
MCLSTKCSYRDLAARGAILKLAEVHGEVRDMLRAEGLQERMEGVEQRVGVAALVASRIRSQEGGNTHRRLWIRQHR